MTRETETAMLYQKGSPMLAKYLEMNRLKAISMGAGGYSVWIENGEGVGFHTDYTTKREARAFARKLADHTGLPII